MSDNGNKFELIRWVPSKKALEAAAFPPNVDPHKDYNIKWADCPEQTRYVGTQRTFRHAMNNEAVSSMLANKAAAEKKNEAFDPVAYLHQYRLDTMAEFVEGRLGIREPSAAAEATLSPLDKEIRDRAFDEVREYIINKGGTFNYTVANARSLAWKNADGETMQSLIDRFVNSTKRGKALVAKAEQTIAERERLLNAARESDPDDMWAAA
jgi:hypothetical protein